MYSIFNFIGTKETSTLQEVNRDWYNNIIPKSLTKLELYDEFDDPFDRYELFESQRKQIAIGFWQDGVRNCKKRTILKIGDGEGEVPESKLGFSEIYFQYFI